MKKTIALLSLVSSASFAAPTFKADTQLPDLVKKVMTETLVTRCPVAFDFGNTDIVELETVGSRAREDKEIGRAHV